MSTVGDNPLNKDVVLQILSQNCLESRNIAQARLVCKIWLQASDELLKFVRLGNVPSTALPASPTKRLFNRLSELPYLESLWLGPEVVRQLSPLPHDYYPSSSSACTNDPLIQLSACSSLTSLRLQPDAQEAYALPQVGDPIDLVPS